jgi:hypothetical protein
MGFNRMSVATVRDPEFVNITSISPLVSKCEIKVLYVGENRNRSYITKEVATEMAQTLPGCPIVGYYIETKEDFGDHGDQIIIDAEGVKFKKLTKPYGFVAPNSRVWFQEFEDIDEFGNKTVREYLMTEGFLWTEQYEECKRVVEMGNPQSMELDEKTLKGHWSINTNTGVEFFIINDAIFSKLCILGEDVEPCFEGADVTAPKVSSTFSKNDEFVQNLFTMMEQLKYTLSNNEGGQLNMENLENTVVEPVVDQPVVEENFSADLGNDNEISTVENQNNIEEFTQDSVSSEDNENSDTPAESTPAEEFAKEDKEENEDDKKDKDDDNEDDDEDAKKKFELLEAEHAELQAKYSALEESYQELINFKNQIEDKEKDDLIASFYMLTDEDKADVIANKANYSLKEIKAELSMICVDKKVNFSAETETEVEVVINKPLTYNLNQSEAVSTPAWVKAVEDTQKRLNK